MRQAALLTLLSGVALAAATGGLPSSKALTVHCKLAGLHYLGTTSQKQKVCITVSATGKALKEYSFAGRFKCDDGDSYLGSTHIAPSTTDVGVGDQYLLGAGAGGGTSIAAVTNTGRFDGSTGLLSGGKHQLQITFTGQVKGRLVTGVLREHVDFGSQSSPGLVCNSGLVRWSARR